MVLPVRLGKHTDSVQPASRSYISWIVKDVMQSAAGWAMEAGDDFSQARLRQASAHWLRHTFATDPFDSGADLLSVRDLLDHASISTTSRYLLGGQRDKKSLDIRIYRASLKDVSIGLSSPELSQ
jgi:integrase